MNRKWSWFKSQYATEICDAFATLLKSLSQLSPWWHIIKPPNGEIINNDFTLTDCLGYDHSQFMILLEIAGLMSLHNKHNTYCAAPKDWVFFFNEYQLNNEVTKYRNKALENKECHYIRIGDDVGCHLPNVQFATKRGHLVPTKPRFNKRRQYAIGFTSTCNSVLSRACFDF